MSLDEQFLEMTDKTIIIEQVNGNVIRFQSRTFQKTKIIQIKNPQRLISGGFFLKN